MEFRDVVETRVSVRQFRKDPVSPADVREMVRLGSLAPSQHFDMRVAASNEACRRQHRTCGASRGQARGLLR